MLKQGDPDNDSLPWVMTKWLSFQLCNSPVLTHNHGRVSKKNTPKIWKAQIMRIQKMVLDVKIDQLIAEKIKVKSLEYFWDTLYYIVSYWLQTVYEYTKYIVGSGKTIFSEDY